MCRSLFRMSYICSFDETSDDSVLVDRAANHSNYPYFTIGSDDAMFVLIGLTFREDLFCFPQEPLAVIRVYASRVLRLIPWMRYFGPHTSH